MAYDNHPEHSVREKRALFAELAAVAGGLALYHDPEFEAAWMTDGELVPRTLDRNAV
jgi:hypothetical protein